MEQELTTYDCKGNSMQEQNNHLTENTTSMKKCPFCAEQIQPEAIKCRYCGEFLDGSARAGSKPRGKKWYYSTPTVVIALLCLGPLALPLVWVNPRYKPITRALITMLVLIATVVCLYLVVSAYQRLLENFSALGM